MRGSWIIFWKWYHGQPSSTSVHVPVAQGTRPQPHFTLPTFEEGWEEEEGEEVGGQGGDSSKDYEETEGDDEEEESFDDDKNGNE